MAGRISRFPPGSRRSRALVSGCGVLAGIGLGLALGTWESPNPVQAAFSAVFSVAAVAAGAVFPVMALVAMFVSGRTELEPVAASPFDVSFWFLFGFALSSSASLLFKRTQSRLRALFHPATAFALLFTVVSVTSLNWNEDWGYPREKAIRIGVYLTAFYVLPAIFLGSERRIASFFSFFLYFSVAAGALALILALSTTSVSNLQRISLPGSGPITLARILATGAILAACRAFGHRSGRRRWWLVTAFLMAVTFATGSRGPALFALAVVMAIPIIAVFDKHLRRRAPGAALVVSALLIGAILAWLRLQNSNLFFVRRFQLLVSEDRGASVNAREENIDLALRLARENHYQPHGLGSWSRLVDNGHVVAYPHNIVIEALYELGSIGLISFLLFVATIFASVFMLLMTGSRSGPRSTLILSSFCVFLFACMSAQVSGDFYDNRLIWLAAGLILVLRSLPPDPASARLSDDAAPRGHRRC